MNVGKLVLKKLMSHVIQLSVDQIPFYLFIWDRDIKLNGPFLCYYFWKSLAFIVVPYKGIWIPESGKFWLVEFGVIQESCNLKSGIQLKETGIPSTIGIRNPTSTDKESEIQYLESENLESKTSWNSFLNLGRFLKRPAVACRTITAGGLWRHQQWLPSWPPSWPPSWIWCDIEEKKTWGRENNWIPDKRSNFTIKVSVVQRRREKH